VTRSALWCLCLTTFVAGGCVDRQLLRPAEGDAVDTVQGHPGARYPIRVAGGEVGEATLWCECLETLTDEEPGSIARFGLTIENHGDADLALDREGLRLALRDDNGTWMCEDVAAAAVDGPETIAPGAVADFAVRFALPWLADPDRVHAARLRWRVAAGEAGYEQVTPFVETRGRRPRFHFSPGIHFFIHRGHHHPSSPRYRYGFRFHQHPHHRLRHH